MSAIDRLKKIYQRLLEAYGPPQRPTGPPLEVLIKTVLSQNTNDRNRDRAYQTLLSRFPNWDSVLSCPEEELASALKPAGLNRQRAKRIKTILAKVKADFGGWDLKGLCIMDTLTALAWLLSLPGVGPKTAYCVLAFGCHKEVFPIDTHILRISKRLGLLPPATDLPEAHELMGGMVPPEIAQDLHLLLIRYGREVCKARKPNCDRCLFPEECLYRQRDGK